MKTEQNVKDKKMSVAKKINSITPKERKVMRDEYYKHQVNVKEILICTNGTPFRGYTDFGYSCYRCDATHPDPADLKKHNLDEHADNTDATSVISIKNRKTDYCIKLDITDLKCKLCGLSIDTLDKVLGHLKYEHKREVYMDIKNKIIPFKLSTEELRCCVCLNTFEKYKKLQEHMNTHYKNYVCKMCDAGFVTYYSLMQHTQKHEIGSFKCEYCPKVFTTLRTKKSHENAVHIQVNMTQKCGYCHERFYSPYHKDMHMSKEHGVKILAMKCRACDKTFNNKRALTTHTRRDHLMERQYKCTQCDMKFYASSELKLHMIRHTGVRKYKCDVCLKAYARKNTLRQHMKIHDKNKRFKCERCGQEFVQKCSWRGHMKNRHEINV